MAPGSARDAGGKPWPWGLLRRFSLSPGLIWKEFWFLPLSSVSLIRGLSTRPSVHMSTYVYMAGPGLSVGHSLGHEGGVASAHQELTRPKPLLSYEKLVAGGAGGAGSCPTLKGSEQALGREILIVFTWTNEFLKI